jgi:hypothetical protein
VKKKLLLLLLVFVLMFVMTAPVFAGYGINWAKICKSMTSTEFAECMKSPAHYCDVNSPYYTKNHGSCVSFWMSKQFKYK